MLTIHNIYNQVEIEGKNKNYLEYFNKRLGHTPNLFLAMMLSNNALSAYYTFHSRKTSLSKRDVEAIALVVAQHNRAMYCLSAHTMIAKLNGFSEKEILELRSGAASFDSRLNALVKLIVAIVEQPGTMDNNLLNTFFAAGYTKEHLIDALQVIGDGFITNIAGKVFDVPIDFPIAKEL